MVLLFVVYFLIFAFLYIGIYRSRETQYLGGLVLCLSLVIVTVLIYFAKKGGMSNELSFLFYGSRAIRNRLQYLNITLSQLGLTLALGRTLYPFILFQIAQNYSMDPFIKKQAYLLRNFWIIAGLIFMGYSIFFLSHFGKSNPSLLRLFLWSANLILIGVTLFSLYLFVKELVSIELPFFKKQFSLLTVFLLSVTLIYLLYFLQEPSQIYHFYDTNFFWQQGLFYLYSVPVRLYIILLLVTLLTSLVATYSITKFTHNIFLNEAKEKVMRQNKQTISPIISMFIHSLKNQFLTQQILIKRIETELSSSQPRMDKIHDYLHHLKGDTGDTLQRINRVYRTLKKNKIKMEPHQASDIVRGAIKRAVEQYPQIRVNICLEINPLVLVDYDLICETMSNLIINGYEASLLTRDTVQDNSIRIQISQVRAFTLFEVIDHGVGMTDKEMKKIFQPFFSSKNSKNNWGMGLYFVQEIAKGHFGGVFTSSQVGQGSTFTLYLPKIKE